MQSEMKSTSPAWQALAELCRAAQIEWPGETTLQMDGDDPVLPNQLRIGAVGAASHAAVGLAAAKLHRIRGGEAQRIAVNVPEAVASLRASHFLTIDGAKPKRPWDDMSGFYRVKHDRWIFLHCNFPNLRDRAAALLGCSPARAEVERACAAWEGEALETAMHAAGGCAAYVRTMMEWRRTPQHLQASTLPILEITRIGDAQAEPLPVAERPLSGVRAIDLTRVIAGPACGRSLAEHGADVLKVSRPDLAHSGLLDIDSGVGKLATYLDFRDPIQAEQFKALIRTGDVFLQSYRPGSLASHGYGPEDIAAIRPGIVVATLSAWGHQGPWSGRRGYDTIVQAATGVSDLCGNGSEPAHMPVAALDYIGGNLLTLGIMTALARRATEGGSWLVRVSLLQTQQWLLGQGLLEAAALKGVSAEIPAEVTAPFMREVASSDGLVRYLGPVLSMSGTPLRADRPPVPLGTNPPLWP